MKISRSNSSFILAFAAITLFAPFAQAQKGSLDDLSFLEGRWLGNFNGGPIEAAWSAPVADNIIGYIRMMKDDKPTMYELFVFEQTKDGPVAMVKHFNPGMVGLEEKDQHDHYKFLKANDKEALFEKDDASVRIFYERRSPTQLVIRRAVEKDGWRSVDLFVFDKMKE